MSKSSNSSVFNSSLVQRIIVIILFICMGICGYMNGTDVVFAGSIYSEISEDWVTYTLSTLILLAGIGLLAPLFVKGMPAVVEKTSMIICMLFWVAVIVFKDFVPGFSGMDFSDFLGWLTGISVDLAIFFSIGGVCAKALK